MFEVIIDSTPEQGKVWANRGYNVVPIDVLRATSTIVVALERGASKVIPCAEIEEAESFKNNPDTILAGERKGVIIPGFDYTNSPDDLSRIDLNGKQVVLTTSDGTRLITQAASAEHVLISSTLNYGAVAQAIIRLGGNWAVIGAGSSGDFRPEDKVGCALVGKELLESGIFTSNEETRSFINEFGFNWANLILASLSTQKLRKIGRNSDVEFVINKANTYTVVPKVINDGKLVTVERL